MNKTIYPISEVLLTTQEVLSDSEGMRYIFHVTVPIMKMWI